MEMLPTENGAKFVDRVRFSVKLVGEQNMSEKSIYNAIVAVLQSAIQDIMPALYQLADLHDMQLDKLYQQIVKNVTAKKKVENHSEYVAVS